MFTLCLQFLSTFDKFIFPVFSFSFYDILTKIYFDKFRSLTGDGGITYE